MSKPSKFDPVIIKLGRMFWTGRGWTNSHKTAKTFRSAESARRECRAINFGQFQPQLIANVGTNKEFRIPYRRLRK